MALQSLARVEWAFGERIKELSRLYGIAHITQEPGITCDEALQKIVELLPPAWQFCDSACARVVLDGHQFATANFGHTHVSQEGKATDDVMTSISKPSFRTR